MVVDVAWIIYQIDQVDMVTPVLATKDGFQFTVWLQYEEHVFEFQSRPMAIIQWKKVFAAIISLDRQSICDTALAERV